MKIQNSYKAVKAIAVYEKYMGSSLFLSLYICVHSYEVQYNEYIEFKWYNAK